MNGVSTLSINLLLEQVYLEGQVHMMYENIMKKSNISESESKSIIKTVLSDMKLNGDFMMTYGLGISAFAGPIYELLHNKNINVTQYDVTLLVMTAFYILLTNSREDISKLMVKLKERGLDKEVKGVVRFISESMGLFKVVGKKVGVTVTTLIDVLSFTFMSVPVLGLLKDLAAQKGFSIDNVEQLVMGVTLSAGSYLVKNILQKKGLKESEDDFDWNLEEISPEKEFLYQKFMECELVESKKRPGYTKYVDKNDKILFLDDIETGTEEPVLYFDYDEIYLKLENFGLNYEEMKKLCIDMLYETHKRKVLTAHRYRIQHHHRVV